MKGIRPPRTNHQKRIDEVQSNKFSLAHSASAIDIKSLILRRSQLNFSCKKVQRNLELTATSGRKREKSRIFCKSTTWKAREGMVGWSGPGSGKQLQEVFGRMARGHGPLEHLLFDQREQLTDGRVGGKTAQHFVAHVVPHPHGELLAPAPP